MAYSQSKLDAVKAAAASAGPCLVEKMQAYPQWKVPALFACTSGVLLWGQLPTVMQGALATELDTALGPDLTVEPGVDDNSTTAVVHCFRYRAPARKGMWKVEVVRGVGYVCHHVDASAPDLLRRAALVGVSHGNLHDDRDIVCVNRYDWSQWGRPLPGHQLMAELLKPGKKRTHEKPPRRETSSDDDDDGDRTTYRESLSTNRLMLVDAHGFPQLVQSLLTGFKLDTQNYLFRDNKGNAESVTDAFGVNLGVGETEFELGWLAFQNEELVGIVYDGVYCHLEGRSFHCGNTKVHVARDPTAAEVEDESGESEEREEDEGGEGDDEREDSDEGCNRFNKRRRG